MINGMLTSVEAAEKIGVTIGCFRQWRARGVNFIPYTRLSATQYLYAEQDVDAFVKSMRVTEPKKKAA